MNPGQERRRGRSWGAPQGGRPRCGSRWVERLRRRRDRRGEENLLCKKLVLDLRECSARNVTRNNHRYFDSKKARSGLRMNTREKTNHDRIRVGAIEENFGRSVQVKNCQTFRTHSTTRSPIPCGLQGATGAKTGGRGGTIFHRAKISLGGMGGDSRIMSEPRPERGSQGHPIRAAPASFIPPQRKAVSCVIIGTTLISRFHHL
jgi:hypothetical protein